MSVPLVLARPVHCEEAFVEAVIVLKISISDSEATLGLQLEGKLIGPWVDELRKLSDEALSRNKTVTLDLGKVWFADVRGVALLQELARRKVSQTNCSQFLSQQLKETAQ